MSSLTLNSLGQAHIERGTSSDDTHADFNSNGIVAWSENRNHRTRESTVAIMVDSLLAHGGPDPKGRIHPRQQKVSLEFAEEALSKAAAIDPMLAAWKPYHFTGITGVFQSPETRDLLLMKRIDHLLTTRFQGSLAKLLTQALRDDILEPCPEIINRKIVLIPIAAIGPHFQKSTYAMLSRYLDLKGLRATAPTFAPYQMSRPPSGTFDDKTLVESLIRKKIDGLLQTKFGGSIGRLIRELNSKDLRAPMKEELAGEEIEVPLATVVQSFGTSPYKVVQEYLRIVGQSERYKEIKPYHFAHTTHGTYNDAVLVDEVLNKKIDQLLRDQYDGNLTRLINKITSIDLGKPFTEEIAGEPYTVSTTAALGERGSSPHKVLTRYLAAKGLTERYPFRPEHLARTPDDVFDDPAHALNILCRKLDQVLATTYGGNIVRLLTEITGDVIESPLIDQLDGHDVEISMARVILETGPSIIAMLRVYLTSIEREDLLPELHPYRLAHAAANSYDDSVIDELIVKKFDPILATWGGDYVAMIQGQNGAEYSRPFIELVAGEPVTISMSVPLARCGSNYEMLRRYLVAKGENGLAAELRPYHLSITTMGTYNDESMCEEVLEKAIDYALNTKFKGDLNEFIQNITLKEIDEPFPDRLGEREVLVRTSQVVHHYQDTLAGVIEVYLRIKGLTEQYKDIRPYHLNSVTSGEMNDELMGEMVEHKVDQLLSGRYQGDIFALLTSTSSEELFAPFSDTLGGKPVEVSMNTVSQRLGHSPYRMLMLYLNRKGLEAEAAEFRPYHLPRTTRDTYANPIFLNEVVKMVGDHLFKQKYESDLNRFVNELTFDDLETPIPTRLLGRALEINPGRTITVLGNSTYGFMRCYLEVSGFVAESQALRPYHGSRAMNGAWDDNNLVDEVVGKKVKELLRGEYKGDLIKLMANVRAEDLAGSFVDRVGSLTLTVRMASLLPDVFAGSPHLFFKRYYQVLQKPFPFTPECFEGFTPTRLRRFRGEFNNYDLRAMKKSDGTYDITKFGFKRYNGPEKDIARLVMIEEAFEVLLGRPCRYLGLEGADFGFITQARNQLAFSGPGSVVVERDSREHAAMVSLQKRTRAGGDPVIRDLTLRLGSLETILPQLRQQFDLVNLDFVGHFAPSTAASIRALWENQLLSHHSVVFLTLADRPIDRRRAELSGFRSNSIENARQIFGEATEKGYVVKEMFGLPYRGGINGDKGAQMVIIGYELVRTDPVELRAA